MFVFLKPIRKKNFTRNEEFPNQFQYVCNRICPNAQTSFVYVFIEIRNEIQRQTHKLYLDASKGSTWSFRVSLKMREKISNRSGIKNFPTFAFYHFILCNSCVYVCLVYIGEEHICSRQWLCFSILFYLCLCMYSKYHWHDK